MLLLLLIKFALSEFIQGKNGTGFDLSPCGVSASCFANINKCQLGEEHCALVSWKMVDQDLEISLAYRGPSSYVSFAFGAVDRNVINGDMAYTDVYYCENRRTSGLGVESAWARANSKIKLLSQFIQTLAAPKLDNLYDDAILTQSVRTNKTGDVYTCTFTRKGTFVKKFKN